MKSKGIANPSPIVDIAAILASLSPLEAEFSGNCIQVCEQMLEKEGRECNLQEVLHLSDQQYDQLKSHAEPWTEKTFLEKSIALGSGLSNEVHKFGKGVVVEITDWFAVPAFQKALYIRRLAFHSLSQALQCKAHPSDQMQWLVQGLHFIHERLGIGVGIVGFQFGELGEIKRGVLGMYCDSYIDLLLYRAGLGSQLASSKIEAKHAKRISELKLLSLTDLGDITDIPRMEEWGYYPCWLLDIESEREIAGISITFLCCPGDDTDGSWYSAVTVFTHAEDISNLMEELGMPRVNPNASIQRVKQEILACKRQDAQLFHYPLVWLDDELRP